MRLPADESRGVSNIDGSKMRCGRFASDYLIDVLGMWGAVCCLLGNR